MTNQPTRQFGKPAGQAPAAVPVPPASQLFVQGGAMSRLAVRIMLWGSYGTHKTRTGLTFPRPAVIDVEGLASIYRGEFPDAAFMVAPDLDAVKRGVQAIIEDNGKTFDTLIVDSLTPLYDGLKDHYLSTKGFLGRAERERINIKMKSLYNLLMQVNINVILICRETDLYADPDDSNSKAQDKLIRIGSRPDLDKYAPYNSHFVVHMTGGGRGTIEKFQGVYIQQTNIADVTYQGFWANIIERLSKGDDPQDIRGGVGKNLFISYWKGQGLTTAHIASALGVKTADEWTKGRNAADKVIHAYAIKHGLIAPPEPVSPADDSLQPPDEPEFDPESVAPPPPESMPDDATPKPNPFGGKRRKPQATPAAELLAGIDVDTVYLHLIDHYPALDDLTADLVMLVKDGRVTDKSVRPVVRVLWDYLISEGAEIDTSSDPEYRPPVF